MRYDVSEMPHLDANVEVGSHHFGTIDLRIERYPLSQDKKRALMQAFTKTGVVGRMRDDWVKFGPGEAIVKASPEDIRRLPKLPLDWEKYMVNNTEEGKKMPKLTEIFRIREAVTPDQLHDPQDFVAKLREVAAEASSESAALAQFLETVDGNPEFNLGKSAGLLKDALDRLTAIGQELAELVNPIERALLQKEQDEDTAKSAGPTAPTTTFKKI